MTNHTKSASNRLAHERSLYLRQHATNPVDWYPWGPEALERAKREDKPILLSVGYSACHWCHVMAHESFEDPEIAALMNAYFVNVKVDREERPDLDQLYQGVVQLLGRGGGWPLTVFLTPSLEPFFGGTYFPPRDKFGMPGFPKILQALHDAWTTRREELEHDAGEFREGLSELLQHGLEEKGSSERERAILGLEDLVSAARALERHVDRRHGGFGGAPKFPNPMNLALLLRAYRRRPDEPSLKEAVFLSLEKMARGGIFDQLGGGFHRYAVDEYWRVPHFEKMLYDNAQLLHLYAEAYQLDPRPLWREVAEQTVAYLLREMSAPEGAFYASQDADSEGVEGKYFVWRLDELETLLERDELRVVKAHYGLDPRGNFEHGASVLEVVRPSKELEGELGASVSALESLLASAKAKMLAARGKRVAPARDEKILAGWNGLMVRGLAFAARVFDRPEWAEAARRAADFVLSRMWRDGRLLRVHQDGESRIEGFIEDYGHLALGLVALYQATFDARHLESAVALVDTAQALFWDETKRAYPSAPRARNDLLVPVYALHDNAAPSGASTLTEAHALLGALLGRAEYLERAEAYVGALSAQLSRSPFAFGHLLNACDTLFDGGAELTLVGLPGGVSNLLRVVNETYAPTLAVLVHQTGAAPPALLEATLRDRRPVDGRATAYLCHRFVCEPPVTEEAALRQALSEPRPPSAGR